MFRFSRVSVYRVAFSVLATGGIALVAGCQNSTPAPDTSSKPLYDRLGGDQAITAVVDDFVGKAAADPAVNFTRKGEPNHWDPTPDNVAKLKKSLVLFIDQNTGGPQKYEGPDMLTVHTGMHITQAQWDAIVVDLKAALSDFKVPDKEQGELIAIVATTHDAIVGH